MKAYFNIKKNILNRFFFIFGNTEDSFCGSNFVYMDLKFSLNKHLKDCGYKRIVFYSLKQKIHCYDDESFNLLKNPQAKSETTPAKKTSMRIKGPLKSRLVSSSNSTEASIVTTDKTTNKLHIGENEGMDELESFKWINTCMKDRNIKTAVIITNANDFIDYFGSNMQNKLFDDFNQYASSTLGHENENIMLFIFPSHLTADEYNKIGAPIWNRFFKPKYEQGKVTEIHIGYPLLGEIRNVINYYRLRHGLKVEFSQLDNMCKKIAKNYYTENRAIDSLILLMAELKDITVLNNETVDAMLGKQESRKSCQQLSPTFDFRGLLANLSEEEIKEAEDVAIDKKEAVSVDEVLKDLNELVGLSSVKETVVKIANTIKGQKRRGETAPIEKHFVFQGNPGTGKTTVARIMGDVFESLGMLGSNKIVEVDRSKLVAQHVGGTAPLVNTACDNAMGGILFIDEAYDLARDSSDQFGLEAVNALLKRMEDDRGKFVCIAAGYTKEMNAFLASNSGFKSRFTDYINFEDYNVAEMRKIFIGMCKKNKKELADGFEESLQKRLEDLYRARNSQFANARTVRQLFEKTKENLDSRILNSGLSDDDIRCEILIVRPEDLDMTVS